MSIVIVESESLHCQSHECSCKEETNAKFKLKGKLEFSCCCMPFKMRKFVEKN